MGPPALPGTRPAPDRLMKPAGLAALGEVALRMLSLLALPVLTRHLPGADYGLWVQANAWVLVCNGFVVLGMPYAILRLYAARRGTLEGERYVNTSLAAVLVTGGGLAAVTWVLRDPIARAFFDGNETVLLLAATTVPLSGLSKLLKDRLRADARIGAYAALGFVAPAVALGWAIWFTTQAAPVTWVVAGLPVGEATAVLALLASARPQWPGARPDVATLRLLIAITMPSLVPVAASMLLGYADRFAVSYWHGSAATGHYSPAVVLGSLVLVVASAVNASLPGRTAQRHDAGDAAAVDHEFSDAYHLVIELGVPYIVGALFLEAPLLHLLAPADFVEAAHGVAPIVAASSLCLALFMVGAQKLQLLGRLRLQAWIWGGALAVGLAALAILVPRFGLQGAATATLLAYGTLAGLTLTAGRRLRPGPIAPREYMPAMVASTALAGALALWRPTDPAAALLAVAVLGPCCLAVMYLLGGLRWLRDHQQAL